MIFNFDLMSYLHIAEKNSIAKEVAQVLSNGSKKLGFSLSKYNPVYQFQLDEEIHRMSSVRGHVFNYELPPECKSWYHYDNIKILSRQVQLVKVQHIDVKEIIKNVQNLAKKSKYLILWLDCDREGQAIAFQVIDIATKVNPKIKIQRARFAAVTRSDVLRAYNNLVEPNKLEADAVNYRMEVDLRIGCAFTRFQTVEFQKVFQLQTGSYLSYGPCQIPTLGFIVQRYLEIKNFKPQKYWFLSCTCVLDQNTGIEFKWCKKNTKDQAEANIAFARLYLKSEQEGVIKGRIIQRNDNIKKRYRPYPLTTVQFQKLASDKLRISSAEAMKIAQDLYVKGFISYPRTQTNAFPRTMNVQNLVKKLQNSNEYGDYIQKLFNENKYQKPKEGNQNDQAHVPIHPVKMANKQDLTPKEWKVYDLISRSFLACCSKDAIGVQSEAIADVQGQKFKASYLTIKEKNYLEIFTFQKWNQTSLAGEVPNVFNCLMDVQQGQTTAPAYLSQSDLITLMEKNQIGTDSTIHQHIKTIQDRNYAVKLQNSFRPTDLGAALVVTYGKLGLKLAECELRRSMEVRMHQIAQGKISKDVATQQTLMMMIPIFGQLTKSQKDWTKNMMAAMTEHSDLKKVQMMSKQEIFRNQNAGQNSQNTNTTRLICFKCKEPGHIAPNCPNNDNRGQNTSRQNKFNKDNAYNKNKFPRKSFSEERSQLSNQQKVYTCYKCNKPGHVISNCPNDPPKNDNTIICFACKQPGHYSKDCPQKQQYKPNTSNNSKLTCFICHQPGHFAPACPQKSKNAQKPKKQCKVCGVTGRHPRGSKCTQVKKRNNKGYVSNDYEDDEDD